MGLILSIYRFLNGVSQILELSQQPCRRHGKAHWTDQKRDNQQDDSVFHGYADQSENAQQSNDRTGDSKEHCGQLQQPAKDTNGNGHSRNHRGQDDPQDVFHGRYGSDFVCDKDGHWKYLHEHVCPDIGCGYDGKSNWGLTAYQMSMDPKAFMPPDMGDYEPRDYQVDDPGPLHRDYGFLVPVQNTCPWPEPYQTMDEAHSYTPPRA